MSRYRVFYLQNSLTTSFLCLLFCAAPCSSAKTSESTTATSTVEEHFQYRRPLVDHPPAPTRKTSVQIDEQGLEEAKQCATKHDYEGAYKRFHLMAKKGCPYSQCIVGIMHQKGIGAEKNAQKALYWFKESAKRGCSDAEHRLGMMHITGDGIVRDVEAGARWLEKAAQHGVLEAKYELGKLDITERSEKAVDDGRRWLQEAASQGFGKAQELSAKLPALPTRETPAATSGVEKGLEGMQHSWTGYADLTNTLDKLSAAASK